MKSLLLHHKYKRKKRKVPGHPIKRPSRQQKNRAAENVNAKVHAVLGHTSSKLLTQLRKDNTDAADKLKKLLHTHH